MANAPQKVLDLVETFDRNQASYLAGDFNEANLRQQFVNPLFTAQIDDKILKTIIKSIYYPSPYVFKEIPAEILGHVYEQFLGKVIRLTTSHQAKVEEKPEVKKSGGVYYTPTYIVDYIVKHTVGQLLGEPGSEPEALATDAAATDAAEPVVIASSTNSTA